MYKYNSLKWKKDCEYFDAFLLYILCTDNADETDDSGYIIIDLYIY